MIFQGCGLFPHLSLNYFHFSIQDEADVLGDRIAIMTEGQLTCVGSSLFLKKHYGVGYQLTIEKKFNSIASSTLELEGRGAIALDDITLRDIVTRAVSDAHLISNVGTEMTFQLPLGAAGSFKSMFEALDAKVDEESIAAYGVSITTLDQVFLKVARGETGEGIGFLSRNNTGSADAIVASVGDKMKHSPLDLEVDGMFFRHFQVLFHKRAMSFKVRNTWSGGLLWVPFPITR